MWAQLVPYPILTAPAPAENGGARALCVKLGCHFAASGIYANVVSRFSTRIVGSTFESVRVLVLPAVLCCMSLLHEEILWVVELWAIDHVLVDRFLVLQLMNGSKSTTEQIKWQ
jgi:hypothetical protein